MTPYHAPAGREPATESDRPADRLQIIRWIVVAVAAWGIVHAVGAWSFNHNMLRAVVVIACVAAFLGFWMAMLAVRQRRLTQRR
jgi:CHASE2 domain-containing sensor protein